MLSQTECLRMAFIKLKEGVDENQAVSDIKKKCLQLNVYSRP